MGVFFVDVNFDKGVRTFLILHVMSELPYEERSINSDLNTGVWKLLD